MPVISMFCGIFVERTKEIRKSIQVGIIYFWKYDVFRAALQESISQTISQKHTKRKMEPYLAQ